MDELTRDRLYRLALVDQLRQVIAARRNLTEQIRRLRVITDGIAPRRTGPEYEIQAVTERAELRVVKHD
jgi:hypothetical protein